MTVRERANYISTKNLQLVSISINLLGFAGRRSKNDVDLPAPHNLELLAA
jgi:hypothetical protein